VPEDIPLQAHYMVDIKRITTARRVADAWPADTILAHFMLAPEVVEFVSAFASPMPPLVAKRLQRLRLVYCHGNLRVQSNRTTTCCRVPSRLGWFQLVGMIALVAAMATAAHSQAHAQHSKALRMVAHEVPVANGRQIKRLQQPGAKESVQADISARTVPVTTSFNGTKIVVFGAVDNSQQLSPESGYYDVVIVVEGVPSRIIVRRKEDVAGLWLNTSAVTFDNVPSYYAIASTRPLDEITTNDFRDVYAIGLQHLRLTPAFGQTQSLSTQDIEDFRQAILRLKEKAGLYLQSPFAVTFNGRSLFRANIVLPSNVTMGPFDAHVYLFHDQKLLSEYSVRLALQHEGFESYVHALAIERPALYGLVAVALAVGAGLFASTAFGKAPRT
jgi:uncharacterized protein (TIGR02186 family)